MRRRAIWDINRRSVIAAAAFATCLAASIAGVWWLASTQFPQNVAPPDGGIHLMLVIEGAGWSTSFESNATRNNTALSFLLEAARALHFHVVWQNWTVPPDSVFVHSIGGDANGDGGRWWQFWVDGVYGTVAANHAALKDGDVLEWRFAQYPP